MVMNSKGDGRRRLRRLSIVVLNEFPFRYEDPVCAVVFDKTVDSATRYSEIAFPFYIPLRLFSFRKGLAGGDGNGHGDKH